MSVVEAISFGHYRLTDLLGRGGMGDVWRAHDTRTDRIVAVKLLPRKLAHDDIFKQRFRREARAAAQLNEPHVVPIHGYGEIDGQLYVDMRLIEGRDLHDLLTTGPLKPARAVMIIDQVAKALHAAHNVGLVHRDVKPSNILVADYDFAYLIDFGIARGAGEATLTSIGTWVGTPYYMAPERFRDGPVDARADIYALACVLHECLTGTTPFPGSSMESQMTAHLTMPPPRPSVVVRGVPATFDAVIAKGMAKDPDQRYRTVLDLAAAARSASSTPIPTLPPPPPSEEPTVREATLYAGDEDATVRFGEPGKPRPPRNRRRLAMIGAAPTVVVLALVAAVSLWVGRDKPGVSGPEIFLEPAMALGQNPFTPLASRPQPPATFPGSDPVGAPVSGGTDPDRGPVSGGQVRAVRGDVPGLYGGTRNLSPCDTGLMTSSLGQNPDRGQAWAATFNITAAQIPAFLSGLTPVLLRTDTRVTSHGFVDGQASPYQAVLEAGTAVLVNNFGVPVVRCGGGNPLLEPVAMTSTRYSGERWKSFTIGAVTVIRPSDNPVDAFILYDSTSGDSFARPLGGNGSNDFPDPRVPTTSTLPRPPLETQTQAPPPPPMTRVTDFPTYAPPSITYAPPIPTQLPRATTATTAPRETSSAPRTSYYKPPTTTLPRRDRSGVGGSTGTPSQKPPPSGSKAPEPTAPAPKPPPKPL
ncbi:MAG TPA: serine/threonine-protein kinase [Mycobacterium sp.]|nr:serine/threonine-protein kinase [Mycobacterium sp.]